MAMSLNFGKAEVCQWIRENFPMPSSILDVGAGHEATWRRWLTDYPNMDAVEAFTPSADAIEPIYRQVFNESITEFEPRYYDLIIFGDVIEHLTVEEAQKVLNEAQCTDMIVAVPFLYPQGILYGNPYEIHKQPDLTTEIFAERYPGFEVLFDTGQNYCYYHRRKQ